MYRLIYFILMCLTAYSVQSQSLDDYLVKAAENNAGLKAKYLEYQAALERVPQVGSLPDPQLSFGYFILPVETRVGAQQAKFSISQMFPWFGTLNAKKDAASSAAKVKFESFENYKNQLYYEIKQVYYQLWALEQNILLTNENLEILRSYESLATSKYENGKVGMVDVIRVQLSIEEIQNDLEIMQLQKEPLMAKFNALVKQEDLTEITFPSDLPELDNIALNDSIIDKNPSIKLLDRKTQSYQEQIRVAKKSGLPTIGLGLSYTIVQDRTDMEVPENGQDILMPQLSIGLPIYRKKYNAMQKEAELKIKATQEDKVNTQDLLLAEFKNAEWKLRDAKSRIDLYNKQIKKAESALNILTTAYSSDNSDFEEVLRMQQQILKYQMELVKAESDLRIANANLKFISGH